MEEINESHLIKKNIIKFFIWLGSISVIMGSIYFFAIILPYGKIVLEKPEVACTQDISDITCRVQAKDNYKNVIVNLQVFDRNNQIVVNTNLVGYNYEKDNEYTLKYSMSLTESLQAFSFRFKIDNYN